MGEGKNNKQTKPHAHKKSTMEIHGKVETEVKH